MSTPSFSRHGAVDLSQLAQRAQQTAGGQAAGEGGYVVELTEQTFETDAIRKSLKHPVIVELYSPRVATGQQLSDALAQLAAENGGRFLLGRLNVDTAPGIVQALQLQAVPTVIALIGGQLAPLFQGVLEKEQAAAAIEQVLKTAVANGIVGRADPIGPQGSTDQDEPTGPDPRFAAADEALERGDFKAAEAEFDKVLLADPGDAEAKAGKAQVGLLARASALDPNLVMLAAAAPDGPLTAQLDAADLEMATGRAEAAFDRLITQLKARSGAERDQVRVRLLELFETLGNTDPRVLKARRDLMTALF